MNKFPTKSRRGRGIILSDFGLERLNNRIDQKLGVKKRTYKNISALTGETSEKSLGIDTVSKILKRKNPVYLGSLKKMFEAVDLELLKSDYTYWNDDIDIKDLLLQDSNRKIITTTNEARAKRIAVDRIVGFAKQFGEEHLNLACHAAFPLALTPDLLYQIWANFVPRSPWTAVARVLLSRLCREVGYEMYEMDIAVRNLLLKELKEQFGQERFEELADFLIDYVAQRLNDDDLDTNDLAQAQEWTALAYTKPSEVAWQLAEALSLMVKQEDMAEVFRLASLVETFAEPLKAEGFEPLLIYNGGIMSVVRGNLEEAKAQFGKLPRQGGQLQVAGVNLDIPVQVADVSLDIPRDMPIPAEIYPGLLLQYRYRVDRLLSRTTFFETWQVNDNGTPKVLKVLRDDFPKLIELFQWEAEVLKQLNHPGIPKVDPDGYFIFQPESATEPLHCLVMEFIEGQNLHEWLEQQNNQPITQEQALNWLKQLVEILAQVHEQKYYHWEIKPSNIMRRPHGQLVLINFGTARDVIDSYVASLKRQEITMIASVGYTPPEQFRGQAVPQSDFFALGRTFVNLLTGKPPREFPEDPETFQLNWRDSAPQVSKSLANLIDDLMAPSPNNRPQNAQVILQRIAILPIKNAVNQFSSWSHSTTLRTQIKDTEILKFSLRELGLTVKTDVDVIVYKGRLHADGYKGEIKIRFDIVAVLEGKYEIGWCRNVDGYFDLIADIDGIEENYNIAELINTINHKYYDNEALAESKRSGTQFVES